MRYAKWFIPGFVLLSLVWCGGSFRKPPSPIVVEELRPDPPHKWYLTGKVPSDSAWIGTRTNALREEDAIKDALNNVVPQVLAYLGERGIYDYQSVRVESGFPISDEELGRLIKEANLIISDHLVRGLKIKEIQIKKWYYRDRPQTIYTNAHVLVEASKKKLEEIFVEAVKEQIKKNQEKNNQKVVEFLKEVLRRHHIEH